MRHPASTASSRAAPGPAPDRRPGGWRAPWAASGRARWSRWWARRHPPTDSLQLTQRNVYILPTAAGWLFAALLGVLLLVSINYQLNLGYLLTFTLAGATAASLHGTHAVLRDLEGTLQVGAPRPADTAAPVVVRLRDAVDDRTDSVLARLATRWRRGRSGRSQARSGERPRAARAAGRTRHSLWVRWIDGPDETAVWTRVPAGGETVLTLSLRPGRRGWHTLPALCLETRFPFGLFRAWSYWRPASRLLAWPVAEADAPALPLGGAGAGTPHPRPGAMPNPDDAGVRPWRRGDAAQQILWRKSAQTLAQGGDPVSREHLPAAAPELRLDWHSAALPDPEARIARLTAWVREADARGARYALSLPGDARPTLLDSGPQHLAHSLDRLACWGDAPATEAAR